MSDKFLAMMRQCEREALTHSCSLHRDSAPSKRFAAAAADWRAMQEDYEATKAALRSSTKLLRQVKSKNLRWVDVMDQISANDRVLGGK